MKISKRISVLIVVVLMTVTMFSCTVPAYAATITKKGSFTCGAYKVNCELITTNNKNASATSKCSFNIFECISAYVVGCETNKSGDAVRYIGNTSYRENKAKESGTAKIALASNSANRFTNIVSAHYAYYASEKYSGETTLAYQYK